ncbi:ComEA family DNA-binding protein [Blastococcus sp. VKM Ac-2987]|uniref:ComEA family DNA-binding protein n=1 Tax=Blastococcus sp. VKM Ac-2987 TaxID=3004141 RepID=UPI0022AB7F7F|nr:ComEA family DNA-binding protein [Blastococcus sp. VKM Ac-2987]MCZ2857379.1 ComEA family DNA-binding protein [Blastococcus sp. VKM Ac-2987]
MRLHLRRDDDADVIRARLRAVLAEPRTSAGGWLPDDDGDGAGWSAPADDRVTVPIEAGGDAERPEGVGRHRAPGTTVRWHPGRPGTRAIWAAALAAVLLVLGWTWWERPRVEPAAAAVPTTPGSPASLSTPPGDAAGEEGTAPGTPSGTAATVVVSVVGQVARPGLVTLASGARVADAVAAAGGMLPDADPASVNLAAPLTDGQQVAVGVPGAVPDGAPAGGAPAGTGGGRVDLNTAGVSELDALPGIGPVLAQRIVDHRARTGGFRSVEELDDVPGIGPTTAAELAELVGV